MIGATLYCRPKPKNPILMQSLSKSSLQAKIAKRLQQFIFTCLAFSFVAITLYILINSPA